MNEQKTVAFHQVKIINFRAYEKVEINFQPEKGVILMHGDNGSGKSTLLNAINWCLYGDTPFYTTQKNEDVLNMHASNGSTASVDLTASIDGKKYRFYRQTKSNENSAGKLDVSFESEGNWTVLDGIRGADAVRRILPRDIRHLFFFNGERLKDIFTKNSENDLRSSVHKVAEIDIIDSAIKHLEGAEKHFLKEISKFNKNADKINELESAKDILETTLKNSDDLIREQEEKKEEIKKQISELDKKIKDTAVAAEHIKNRDMLRERIEDVDEVLSLAKDNRQNLIQENYHRALLNKVAQKYKVALEKASEAGSIPSPVSPKVTSEILHSGICICGTKIGPAEKHFIELKHADYKQREELRFLTDGILTFSGIKQKVDELKYTFIDYEDAIEKEELKKQELQEELKKVQDLLSDMDIANLHDNPEESRIRLEDKLSTIDIIIGSEGKEKADIIDRLNAIEKDLKINIREDDKTLELENNRETAVRLRKKLINTKEVMENNIREKLQKNIWITFKKILPGTNYAGLRIDEFYNITLYANDGVTYYPHNLSEGQAKALGLSLANGLSADLGYSGIPVMIDNVFGNIGEVHYRDITEVISELAKNKQVIVMDLNAEKTNAIFSPAEIKQRFIIERNSNDNQTLIKEIK